MFSCIKASAFGKNLLSSGSTTCRYQSSTSVTSNLGGVTEAFMGRYMSANSDRVQFRRNWVNVALLISDTFLCGVEGDDNTVRHFGSRVLGNVWDEAPREGHTTRVRVTNSLTKLPMGLKAVMNPFTTC